MLRRTMLQVTIVAQSAYVSDPIAQHVVVIDLELKEVTGEIELDFAPSAIAWWVLPQHMKSSCQKY